MTLAKVDPYQDKINHPPQHISFCPIHHTDSLYDSHKAEFKPAKEPRLSDKNNKIIQRKHSIQQSSNNNDTTTKQQQPDGLQCTCFVDTNNDNNVATSNQLTTTTTPQTISTPPHIQSTNTATVPKQSNATTNNTNNNVTQSTTKSTIPTLNRSFLIFMTILRDTDGRDKLTKAVQHTLKLLVWYMKRINSTCNVLANTYQQQQGKNTVGIKDDYTIITRCVIAFMLIAKAVRNKHQIMINNNNDIRQSSSILTTYELLLSSIQSIYSTTTAAQYAKQTQSNLKHYISKTDKIISNLSSSRKVMRLFKWCYTLPALNKSYYMFKQDIIKLYNHIDVSSNNNNNNNTQTVPLDEPQLSKAHTVAVDVDIHKQSKQQQQHTSLTQYLSFNKITQLPIFSTLEFTSHILSVMTDLCDDIQWYSSVKLLPTHYASNAASIGPYLWGSSIVLDIILTYRQILGLEYALNEAKYAVDKVRNKQQDKSNKLTNTQSNDLDNELQQCHATYLQLQLGLYNQRISLLKLFGDAGCCIPIDLGFTDKLPEPWIPTFSLISAGSALHKLWIATKP